MRSSLSITFSVWQAIFLREALDRLFDMRAAWFWLLMEPVCHIGFIALVWRAIRTEVINGVDVSVWVMVGMLGFFLFRRTAIQVMYAIDCNRVLFAYRQVKPFDTAIVRAGLEAFLMAFISAMILTVATLLGHATVPDDPLLVMLVVQGLWLLGLGYGLITSVLIELVPELEHIFKMMMMPLYIISGVIWPISSAPPVYREFLLINPIAHGLELVRKGFVCHYHPVPGVSLSYLYTWAVIIVFIGLMLHRRFAQRLVTQ